MIKTDIIRAAIESGNCKFFSHSFGEFEAIIMTPRQQREYISFCNEHDIKASCSYRKSTRTSSKILRILRDIGIDCDSFDIISVDIHSDNPKIAIVYGILELDDCQQIDFVSQCKVDATVSKYISKFFEES